MDRIKIKVEKREVTGKEAVKKMRKQGYVPAVVYGEDINTVLTVDTAGLRILQDIHYSESAVLDMEIAGETKGKSIPVLVKDVQFHPLTERVIHVDFLKVSLKEKIKVHIPIVLTGEAKQVKEESGTLEQILRELEVEGLPLDIPENIEVDISELTIGHSLHVSNLALPAGVVITTDPEETVATALAKVEEVEEEAVVDEEVATEPEVIKEKKEGSAEESGKEEEQDKKDKKE